MLERLLNCKLCNGKVSSEVTRCPHCGTTNFRPDSYMRERKALIAANERRYLLEKINRITQLFRQQGYVTTVDRTIYQTYFSNEALVSLELYNLAACDVRYSPGHEIKLYFDGNLINYREWIYEMDTEYSPVLVSGNVLVRPGAHQMILEYAGVRKMMDFTINKFTKTIIVNYKLRIKSVGLFHTDTVLKDASIQVK